MKRRLSTLLVLAALIPLPSLGAGPVPDAIETPQELGQFLRYYYADPSPDLVDDAIKVLVIHRGLQGTDAGALVIGFFGQVFHDHRDRLDRWSKLIAQIDPTTRATLGEAMEFSGNPRQFLENTPPSPERNELCWGAFFASGDRAYLDMLIGRLRHLNERDDLNLYVTAAAAQWSLATHAEDHPRVREALERAKSGASPDFEKILEETLASSPDEIRGRSIEILNAQREAGVW